MQSFDKLVAEAENETKGIGEEAKLAEAKARYLGASSEIKKAFGTLKSLPKEEKAAQGLRINEAKNALEALFARREEELRKLETRRKLEAGRVDITMPGRCHLKGSKHPNSIIIDELTDFFVGMGYRVAEGDEVDLDLFNFELVNIPADHPARDMQDSFYIDDKRLLRSHTTAVQAHVMQNAKGQGPIKIICPGKVYRRDDDDLTHSHQFTQCEGLVIAEKVSMGTLMETLTLMLRFLFGEKREVRFRPSFFPFTEPSIEADVSCFECGGKGCDMCKHTGWIEVLGAGMVHSNVLRLNGFDDRKYAGFAFGVGIDRLAMLKYGIEDIRELFGSDLSFLSQFRKEM